MLRILLFSLFTLIVPTFAQAAELTIAPYKVESDTIKPKNKRDKKAEKEAKKAEKEAETPKVEDKKADNLKKEDKKAVTDKKAEEKKKEEEKKEEEKPKIHPLAIVAAFFGVVAIAGLVGFFIMPILGLGTLAAVPAALFGSIALKKIKKDRKKWIGVGLTTFAGMSVLMLLAYGVLLLAGLLKGIQ
jgi:cation transport ATPase